MTAQVIPFDPNVRPRLTTSAEEAWRIYDEESRAYLAMVQDPSSTSDQRLRAAVRLHRLHRIFCNALEAM